MSEPNPFRHLSTWRLKRMMKIIAKDWTYNIKHSYIPLARVQEPALKLIADELDRRRADAS